MITIYIIINIILLIILSILVYRLERTYFKLLDQTKAKEQKPITEKEFIEAVTQNKALEKKIRAAKKYIHQYDILLINAMLGEDKDDISKIESLIKEKESLLESYFIEVDYYNKIILAKNQNVEPLIKIEPFLIKKENQ